MESKFSIMVTQSTFSISGGRGPRLVRIPGGSFLMGSEGGQDNERPVHRVTIDGFYLAATQVTNTEYGEFLRATTTIAPPFWNDPNFSHARQPVVGVSWLEAARYCEWLSEQTGGKYRLPTEAEWERAARGGAEGTTYPWGEAVPESLPHYGESWRTGPEPVGKSQPNAFGLHEMCENVHEWCSDWFDPNYYAMSPELNPQGPASGQRRSSRGGAWRHHIKVSRCAARSSIPPMFQYADYGFRVACGI